MDVFLSISLFRKKQNVVHFKASDSWRQKAFSQRELGTNIPRTSHQSQESSRDLDCQPSLHYCPHCGAFALKNCCVVTYSLLNKSCIRNGISDPKLQGIGAIFSIMISMQREGVARLLKCFLTSVTAKIKRTPSW